MRIKLARSQIAGVLERNVKRSCDFCGTNWGLRSESMECVEDLFLRFWKSLIEEEKPKNKCNYYPINF